MGTKRYIIVLTVLTAFIVTTQCKKKKEDEPEEFKKETILINLADNYIAPGYNRLQLDVNAFNSSWLAFSTDPSASNFADLKTKWAAASMTFQALKFVEAGPAMDISFSAALGTFPADTTQIENNIAAGTYDLSTMANIDAVGFDAFDFLFYGEDAYNKLVISAARRQYVQDIITKMKTETDLVANGWSGYRSAFIAGTGTETTSSFSVLVNAFCKDFEIAKAAKVGIPIGTATLGVSLPEYFEARRSGLGKELLKANIKGLYRFYLGSSFQGSAGTGFDDYLIELERTELATTIDERFAHLSAEPLSWAGSVEETYNSSPSTLTSYYQYMHGTVPFIKVDMASAFGVLITYQDNDGD